MPYVEESITPAIDSRLRSLARRRGYKLCRSRQRLHINNAGGYMIVDPWNNLVVAGVDYDLAPSAVEAWLTEE